MDDEDELEDGMMRTHGAKGAVGMEQWRQFVHKYPEKVSQIVRKNITKKLCESAEGYGEDDPRLKSATEYFTLEGGFDKACGVPHCTWVMATAFNQMGRGEWYHAEATLALGLSAVDQSLMDKGR